MPLIDDIHEELSEEEAARRKFLGLLGSGALTAACAGTAITGVQYIWPNVLYEAQTRFKVGRPENIAPGTVLFLPRQKVLVVHGPTGFFALSATCTHLGCMTRFEPQENRIFCPCHGSRFDLDGRVTGGPAPRPLTRLSLALESGQLVVDSRKAAAADAVLKV